MSNNLKSEMLKIAKRLEALQSQIEAGDCEGCEATDEFEAGDFTAELEAMLAEEEKEVPPASDEGDESSSEAPSVKEENKVEAEIKATEAKLAALKKTATELKTFNRTGITDIQTSAKSAVDATTMSAVAGRKSIDVVKASLNEAKPKLAALAEKFEKEGNVVAALNLDKMVDAINSFSSIN